MFYQEFGSTKHEEECTYELWHTFDFVVLLYKQKPMSDMIIGSGSILHISQRVGSHFNRGAETAEKESCASVQGLLRASHNLVNNQICKRFWFVGHPNVCLVSYFGLPCSNKASFDRNLNKKQMYTMENGKMMRGQQNPIKIPENVFPPTHSSSPSPQFEAPTYLRTTSTGQCNSYPIRNVFYSSNLLLYNEVSEHKN